MDDVIILGRWVPVPLSSMPFLWSLSFSSSDDYHDEVFSSCWVQYPLLMTRSKDNPDDDVVLVMVTQGPWALMPLSFLMRWPWAAMAHVKLTSDDECVWLIKTTAKHPTTLLFRGKNLFVATPLTSYKEGMGTKLKMAEKRLPRWPAGPTGRRPQNARKNLQKICESYHPNIWWHNGPPLPDLVQPSSLSRNHHQQKIIKRTKRGWRTPPPSRRATQNQYIFNIPSCFVFCSRAFPQRPLLLLLGFQFFFVRENIIQPS